LFTAKGTVTTGSTSQLTNTLLSAK